MRGPMTRSEIQLALAKRGEGRMRGKPSRYGVRLNAKPRKRLESSRPSITIFRDAGLAFPWGVSC
jgi:hypothetical protein